MKRAFPQKKVMSDPLHLVGSDPVDGQPRQVVSDVNRKACTSAAMIGLALSMGASSLLLPRQDDHAVAAEPIKVEPTVATVPLAFPVATLPIAPEVEPTVIPLNPSSGSAVTEHAVQQGQTLWQLSRVYQVDATAIASQNGISPVSVLHVGQVLRIPTAPTLVAANTPELAEPTSATKALPESWEATPTQPAYYAPVEATSASQAELSVTPDQAAQDLLKEKQEIALSRLREKQDALRNSLAELDTSQAPLETAADSSNPEVEAAAIEPTLVDQQDLNSAAVLTTPEVNSIQPSLEADAAQASPVVEREAVATTIAPLPVFKPAQADSFPIQQPVQEIGIAAQPEITQPESIAATPEVIPSADLAVVSQPEPVVQPQATRLPDQVAYQVNPGDTLEEIARNYGVSSVELAQLNQLDNPNLIRVNQVLNIPQSQIQAPKQIALGGAAPEASVPTLASLQSVAVETTGVEVPTVVAFAPTAAPVEASLEGTVATAEIPIATAPLNQTQFGTSPAAPQYDTTQYSPYVENLRGEILRLREKYRSQDLVAASPVTPAAPVTPALEPQQYRSVPAPAPQRINPEFKASQSTDVRALQERQRTRQLNAPAAAPAPTAVTPAPVRTQAQPQIVAAAPLGSNAYDPVVQPSTGRMVSPDLPPLAAADRYLPEAGANFEGYVWPAKGVLTSGYGWRWGRMHRGLDIAGPVGTPIVAAGPGTVVTAGWNSGGYGNLVEIRHPDGSLTLYAHNNRLLVRPGQKVEQGQQIAEMGSTGYSTGPHLHFEIHPANQGAVNPIALLPR